MTRSLDALGALKVATITFQLLPAPTGTTEKEIRVKISSKLKEVHAEIMAVVFATSMIVDSTMPQEPQKH